MYAFSTMKGRNMSNASLVSRVNSSTRETVAFARSTMSVMRPPPQRGRTRSRSSEVFRAAALTIGVDIASKRSGVTGFDSMRAAISLTIRKPVSFS